MNNVCSVIHAKCPVKPGSQYDAGAVKVTEKSFFHQSNCIPNVKFFNNLIGWMLAIALAMLRWNRN